MRTYSQDLRERIVKARGQGHSAQEVAGWLGISKRSVERYWKQYCSTGALEPKRRGGYRRSRLEGHEKALRGWIKKQADLTLGELQARCLKQLDVSIGITALWHRLEHLGLSYKKNAARRRARPARHQRGTQAVAQPAGKLGHRASRFSG